MIRLLRWRVFEWVWILGVCSVTAYAYIPPSEFLIKQSVQRRQTLKSARIKSQIVAYESNRLGGLHFRATTYYSAPEGLLRTWITDDQDRKLYIKESTQRSFSPVISLWLEPDLTEVIRSLKSYKIPVLPVAELEKISTEELRREAELTHLARFEKVPAWVIARSIKDGPQLWIDKDSFFPTRFVFDRRSDNDSIDVRFESVRQAKDLSLPRGLVVAKGSGRLFFREEIAEILTQVPPQALTEKSTGFTELGNALPSEMRTLILNYVESLR